MKRERINRSHFHENAWLGCAGDKAFTAFIAMLSAGIIIGCGRTGAAPAAKQAIVVISGDTTGWIVPCGCTANQSGGLLRRGTFLRQLRQNADVIYVDVGGAPAGNSPYQLAKFQAILVGENLMGISAHNLGRPELAFGPEALRSLAAETHSPFISTNASAADQKPLADEIRIVMQNGRRIAFVGVLSPGFATALIRVEDPEQAITRITASQKGNFDALIVLAYMPEDELQKLAASFPEADAVVGGPTGQAMAPRAIGPVLLASATNKGKFLIQLTAPLAVGGRWTGQVQEMGPALTDDPAQVQNLHAYLTTLGQKDFSAEDAGLTPPTPIGAPTGYRIAGSVSCVSCHAATNTAWQSTAHAHAWQTLVTRQFHVDSYCQQCHTTGYGLPGGFESRAKSPALVNVGCESCHGPSLAHVMDPHTRTTYDPMDQCVRCHDHENSPRFDRSAYWEKIRHGKPASPATGATQ